jgi:GT2 family glycosyltransferase
MPDARLICLPGNFGAAARNIGVRLAGSEFVAFSDDDSWWEPGALARAREIMAADGQIGLLAGRVRVEPSGEDDPVCRQMAEGPLGEDLVPTAAGRRAVTGFLACAAVVRTRAFLSVGGFPAEMLVGGEEQMVAWDLWSNGWKALYAPEICAVHQPAAERDPRVRRRLTTRNDLWAGWLRFPGARPVSHTCAVLGRSPFDPAALAGATDALRQLRSVVARRSPLPVAVAAACARQ